MQLLYNLGLEDDTPPSITSPITHTPAPWPPMVPLTHPDNMWHTPPQPRSLPLPLHATDSNTCTAAVANITTTLRQKPTTTTNKQTAADLTMHYLIGTQDMETIYMSPDPYCNAFEEELTLHKFNPSQHKTTGLCFIEENNRILLAHMSPSSPGSKIPQWQTNLCGAWLISINNTPVTSIAHTQNILAALAASKATTCTLLFDHLEADFRQDISPNGLPVMATTDFNQLCLDQLNNR